MKCKILIFTLTICVTGIANPSSFRIPSDEALIFHHSDINLAVNGAHLRAVAMGDVNYDGFDDHLKVEVGSLEIVKMISGADGLELHSQFFSPTGQRSIDDLGNTGDLDGDFISDYYVLRNTVSLSDPTSIDNTIVVSSGANGNTIFISPPLTTSTLNQPNVYFKSDFTNDGVNDLVVQQNNNFRVFDGSNFLQISNSSAPMPGQPSIVGDVSDKDGDGIRDLMISYTLPTGAGAVSNVRYFSLASGLIIPSSLPFSLPFGASPISVMDDINGDSQEEYLVQSLIYGLQVWSPASPMAELFSIPLVTGAFPYSMASTISDIDQDSIRDIMALSMTGYPGSIRLFSGATGAPLRNIVVSNSIIGAGLPYRGLDAIGDINSDGIEDISFLTIMDSSQPGPFNYIFDRLALSSAPLQLTSNVSTVSIAAGGVVQFNINAGAINANKTAIILGTSSGISPGFNVNGVNVPLNSDGYLNFMVQNANVNGSFGLTTIVQLDGCGKGVAQIVAPQNLPAMYSGVRLHHAAAIVDTANGTITSSSNPVVLTLLP